MRPVQAVWSWLQSWLHEFRIRRPWKGVKLKPRVQLEEYDLTEEGIFVEETESKDD